MKKDQGLPPQEQTLSLDIVRVIADPNPVPRAAQKFVWTRVGPDVLIEVGCWDMLQLLNAIEHAKSAKNGEPAPSVQLLVTDRFLISIPVFLDFADGLKKAAEAIREEAATGKLPEGQVGVRS